MLYINECEQLGPSILKSKKLFYKHSSKDVIITQTDKSKCLIALDTSQYIDMVGNSRIASGNYEDKKRINLPKTEQIRFNGQVNRIAKRYK